MQEYKNEDIIVRFDPSVCIHSGNCVRGLRAVFDTQRRPWVDVDAATVEAIEAQIKRCPSGALTCERRRKSSPGPQRGGLVAPA
jgi:uncharacterized Fe-S cluster protein YjdI